MNHGTGWEWEPADAVPHVNHQTRGRRAHHDSRHKRAEGLTWIRYWRIRLAHAMGRNVAHDANSRREHLERRDGQRVNEIRMGRTDTGRTQTTSRTTRYRTLRSRRSAQSMRRTRKAVQTAARRREGTLRTSGEKCQRHKPHATHRRTGRQRRHG
ncbi:hypothetical protein TRVL_06590 [Trypanosoma vivax]|nr:hypothetical protein TRVL_06590 [Trypanosoma vivax]